MKKVTFLVVCIMLGTAEGAYKRLYPDLSNPYEHASAPPLDDDYNYEPSAPPLDKAEPTNNKRERKRLQRICTDTFDSIIKRGSHNSDIQQAIDNYKENIIHNFSKDVEEILHAHNSHTIKAFIHPNTPAEWALYEQIRKRVADFLTSYAAQTLARKDHSSILEDISECQDGRRACDQVLKAIAQKRSSQPRNGDSDLHSTRSYDRKDTYHEPEIHRSQPGLFELLWALIVKLLSF